MEKIFYELKPFLCFGLGLYSLTLTHDQFGKIAALMLIGCGVMIFIFRYKSRKDS